MEPTWRRRRCPSIMQKGKMIIILFGLDVNHEFKYNKFFAMIPTGPDTKPSFTEGFFDMAAAQNPKPRRRRWWQPMRNSPATPCEGARENAKKHGFKVVYDKTYPPATTDFSPIVRAIQAPTRTSSRSAPTRSTRSAWSRR
jgi:branched-chain amino acid transport system substrate-binding protein